ncbi:MAG TPA: DUF58 domain-containing protein [Firmicutes bacterium]|nr:DUF58 domain-containing protein [Bacillota bacterium]
MGRRSWVAFWGISFAVLALYAGLRGQLVAFLGSLVMLTAIGSAYLWNRTVFKKLSVERTLNRERAEFDAVVTMDLGITNRKLLPLFGLKLENTFSHGLEFADQACVEANPVQDYDIFSDYFHLNWYERLKRSYEIRPKRRGRFELGAAALSYTDPFGFFCNEQKEATAAQQLIVFPRVVPIQGQSALDTHLFGSRPKEGWIFTDPLNLVGTRPYEPWDPAGKINWKASARHLRMQVNVEKPAFDQEIYLFLDQPPNLDWWAREVSNNLEVAIIAAASLITNYTEAGYQISLGTNLASRVHGFRPKPIKADLGRGQRSQLLTSLALLQGFSAESGVRALGRLQQAMRPGSTMVVITTAPGELDEAFARLLRRLAAKSPLAVLRVVVDGEYQRTPGLKEWFLDGGQPWDELGALELS